MKGENVMDKKRLQMLIEVAIFAAIGLVLDKLSFSIWAQGGSVSFVMLPIVLISIRWGIKAGLTTGLLVGLLQLVSGAYILNPIQAAIDYLIAFTIVGVAAVVRKPILNNIENKTKIILFVTSGVIIAGFLRFLAHMFAGYIFFRDVTSDQNAWWVTISYNGSYMLPATILTAIVACLLFTSAPKLLNRNN